MCLPGFFAALVVFAVLGFDVFGFVAFFATFGVALDFVDFVAALGLAALGFVAFFAGLTAGLVWSSPAVCQDTAAGL